MEYTIEKQGKWAVLTQGQVMWTSTHSFASVFRSKDRALKLALKHGGNVEQFYGFTVLSEKSKADLARKNEIRR